MTTDDIRDETITEFAAARRAGGYSSQLTGQSLAWMLGYLRDLGGVRPAPVPDGRRAQGTCSTGSGHSWRTIAGWRARRAALTWTRRAGSWRRPSPGGARSGPLLSALTASDVTAFLAGMARVQAPGTTQNTASMLRTFLTWLYSEGLTAAPLAGTVPGAYRRRRFRMPALVTGADAAALLAACDRATAQGLRDYAIVLILTRMGLRAREIAALTLEDVDWRSGIVVISGKGGRRDQLPLPRDVAGAVIAYLRDGRPAAALDRALFVRSVAPHCGLTGYAVGHAVARAARRAGLDRVRPHQLRYLARERSAPARRWPRSARSCGTRTSAPRRCMPRSMSPPCGRWPLPGPPRRPRPGFGLARREPASPYARRPPR